MLQVAYFQMAGSGKYRNQDALFNGMEVCYALLHKTRRIECIPNAPMRLDISDGVSCSPASHLASRFWMETFMQHGDAFGRFLCQYHGQFCEAMTEAYFGSAATFVSATITPDGQCHVCNVGDSRAYRITAAGAWQQVSHDHTVLAELIEQGQAQADQHYAGLYDALTQCLIADSGESDFKVYTHSFKLLSGESVVVCSDGLSNAITHAQLEAVWSVHLTLEEKLEALRKSVKKQSHHDDCSVVCAHYSDKHAI